MSKNYLVELLQLSFFTVWFVILCFADCLHKEEAFWEGRKGTQMGTRAEDPPRFAPPDTKMFGERPPYTELNQMAEDARRRAEIARYNIFQFYELKI